MRREMSRQGHLPWSKRVAMKWASWALLSPSRFHWLGRLGRTALRWMPRFLVYNPGNAWGRQRELPEPPELSFREMFRAERRKARQRRDER
jgi:L-lactate dehydrogenase complex protein LldF